MTDIQLLRLPLLLLDRLDLVWTLLLIFTRFTSFFFLVPGIGSGERGVLIRVPAIFILALVSLGVSPVAATPTNWVVLGQQVLAEISFGFALGFVPLLLISGVQVGAQIASTSMGLGVSQLIDPMSNNSQTSDLGHIYGNLTVLVFLLLNGHHVVLQAVSGVGGQLRPGSFVVGEASITQLVTDTSAIFETGLMVAAPIMVALLLTQFVMGLISKAVPQVNIFVVSFPLTIGIGLTLASLGLPEVVGFIRQRVPRLEQSVDQVASDAELVDQQPSARPSAASAHAP